MSADKAPGTSGTTPPADLVPPPPPDEKPASKRPTTRAGRAAAAEAAKAKKSAKSDSKPSTSKPRKATLETRLAGSLVSLGTLIAATGGLAGPAYAADGLVIVEHSADVAAALDKVAKNDPRVAAALERMLSTGTWSGLVAAMLPVVVKIAANHDAIPASVASIFGASAVAAAPDASGPPPGGPVGVV